MSDSTIHLKRQYSSRQPRPGLPFRTTPRRAATLLLPLLLILLLPYPGRTASLEPAAADNSPRQLVTRLQEKYRRVTSLGFDFTQVTRGSGRERHGQGNAVFLRPRVTGSDSDKDLPRAVMRWNYTAPDRQVILNDGRELSIYNIGERQLIITPARELNNDITYAFFAGTRNLLDDFRAVPPDPRLVFSLADRPLQAVRLLPRKPQAQVKSVQLWVDDKLLIHHLVIEDHFDSITELTFTNIHLDSVDVHDPDQVRRIVDLQLQPGTEIITR